MNTYSNSMYGYKIISDNLINFYHILLPKISIETLQMCFPHVSSVKRQQDGSITIQVAPYSSSHIIVEELISYFNKKSLEFLETPKYYYKVDYNIRQSLKSWSLAFTGCLGLLLTHNPKITLQAEKKWHYINSRVGGLFLPPFTLFLYEDYPKVIHPVIPQNYDQRKTIEYITAHIVRSMITRVKEAQPGLEGIALLSFVETKTKLPPKEIRKIINEKSFTVQTPTYSPFFAG